MVAVKLKKEKAKNYKCMYYVGICLDDTHNDIMNLNIYTFYLLFNISSILMKLPQNGKRKYVYALNRYA